MCLNGFMSHNVRSRHILADFSSDDICRNHISRNTLIQFRASNDRLFHPDICRLDTGHFPHPESSKRVLHGEAVFCFELQRFGVNTPRERAIAKDLAFFPQFSQAKRAALDSLDVENLRAYCPTSVGRRSELSRSLVAELIPACG